MFNYFSFGYIPTGRTWPDLRGRFRGVPNLLKRLQARQVMEILAPRPGEKILDFGCGGGFFTYEFARAGASAWGVDIATLPHRSLKAGSGEARYLSVPPNQPLPFEEGTFDTVKAHSSEDGPFIDAFLVAVNEPGVFYGEDLMLNYTVAWVLSHYLLHADDGAHREAFVRYIQAESIGKGGRDVLYDAIGMDAAELDVALLAHVKKMK